MSVVPLTTVKTVAVDGVNVFYREAGDSKAPVFLLLHGFPTSSFQYRNLITKLAVKYRVIVRAPRIMHLRPDANTMLLVGTRPSRIWIYGGPRLSQICIFLRKLGKDNRAVHIYS